MCHPGFPLVSLRGLPQWQGRSGFQATMEVVQRATASATRQTPELAEAAARGGRGGRSKQCLCSPTSHPGSFRCRHHHVQYVWGGRIKGPAAASRN